MFCCFPLWRTSRSNSSDDERKPIIRSQTTINYQTTFTIPNLYAHVIRDDKIPVDSPNVVEKTVNDTYLLFKSPLPDQEYKTECFSFDIKSDVSTPVVISTRTTDGHFYVEHVVKIEHVTAVRPSTTVLPSRPYDEFPVDSTTSNNPSDGQSNSSMPKPD